MSPSLNRVVLIGHVGTRPEVGATRSGARVATFRLATDRWTVEGGEPKTDWHTIVAWDRLVPEVERWVHKGDRVYVEGRIETRTAKGRRGEVREVTEIVAEDVIPLTA
ncbi:MAG: single-stranded DNA-binding protein [Gemmatimonadetes bacterium]|nr:single-stranded DNA-binding protein [Gemmatimonadota bacterium]